MKKKTINIFSENVYSKYALDEKKAIDIARGILEFYLKEDEILNNSCLSGLDFNTISFDILYCDNEKTHQVNKEYRSKDYPADIITFAIFADSEEKFIFDGEINLGEIIISLDKVVANVKERCVDVKMSRGVEFPQDYASTHPRLLFSEENNELYFLIAHGIMHLLEFDHQTNEDYNFIVKAQTDALVSLGVKNELWK